MARVVLSSGAMPGGLVDAYGRRLDYLRLSVTDRCNFRCAYCQPQGCPASAGPRLLDLGEIARLGQAFAAMAFRKVRITGGEPTLRGDVVEIVAALAAIPGLERIGLTTNGYRLARLAEPLKRAGLASLNVSLDSLDRARFEQVTGLGRLEDVLAGVRAAIAAGIEAIKVNAVLLRGFVEAELDGFLELARGWPITVRFIELMRTDDNAGFFERFHLPAGEVARQLGARGWTAGPPGRDHGVATPWAHPDHAGRVGIISAFDEGFCARCNRLRVTAGGDLRPCLFGEESIPLRPLLASDDQLPALMARVAAAVAAKPAGHRLREGRSGKTSSLAVIGG